ncbi:MAG: hypothetical protein QOF77_2363 [Solirubrobacteraceae bacterium]|nr:hypothetical protein [Solirubrobacteraceae bacterium]
MSDPRVGAVILAAGEGSRFGAVKQLAILDGRPLIEHAVEAVEGVAAIGDIVVVLGAHAEEIRAGAALGSARSVVCPDWASGPTRSLLRGLEALGEVDAMLVTLADQPRITTQVIAMVLDYGLAARAPATRATYAGAPGHPVLFRRSLFARLGRSTDARGARGLLAEVGARQVEVGHLCDPLDVDTPEDMESLGR